MKGWKVVEHLKVMREGFATQHKKTKGNHFVLNRSVIAQWDEVVADAIKKIEELTSGGPWICNACDTEVTDELDIGAYICTKCHEEFARLKNVHGEERSTVPNRAEPVDTKPATSRGTDDEKQETKVVSPSRPLITGASKSKP